MQEELVMKRVCYLNNVESKFIDVHNCEWLNCIDSTIKTQTEKI